MSNEDNKYWLGFSMIPGIGRVRFGQIERYFGNLKDAWQASPAELKQAGLDDRTVKAVSSLRPAISLDTELEKLERYRVKIFSYHDEGYPSRLKEIYDYPPVLYLRGSLLARDEWRLAVVGTRRPTAYGRQVTEEIVTDLSQNEITIVSGLARGIDSVAHRSALESGGRTIAVFACGLDIVYPVENTRLAQQIMQQGALLSEYPLGTRPRAENFPRRNRILSGISLGALVVEAGPTSGALITAQMALEQDREVFAVPGSILSAASQGTNNLIKEGAKLVQDYTDVMEELNLAATTSRTDLAVAIPQSDTEARLLKQLGDEPSHIDEICRRAELPMATISSTLAMMELRGLVKQVGGMNYVLSRGVREASKV